MPQASPLQVPDVRRFIAFRIFFNSRFYYPIFTILFLDFGLSVDQFALLNAVWAGTIVLSEVPSGALADAIGRRRLLIFTGILMVVEMAIIALVPLGNVALVFGAFLLNRILSGLAEAAASGADEALAYDALERAGLGGQWGRVLEVQMRCQSIGFILAMVVGAAVYDPRLVQQALGWIGVDAPLTQADTLRWPIYLTLVMAVLTLVTALRMTEVRDPDAGEACAGAKPVAAAFRLTLAAGGWILRTPWALAIILFGLLFDGIIRSATASWASSTACWWPPCGDLWAIRDCLARPWRTPSSRPPWRPFPGPSWWGGGCWRGLSSGIYGVFVDSLNR
jgi:MFS family permease